MNRSLESGAAAGEGEVSAAGSAGSAGVRITADRREDLERIIANVERAIKGKREVVELAVITLISRGHLLIEDVPGVGKTTLALALARSIGCSFKRIQFTSDLLPADIIGVNLFNQQAQEFEFKTGPLFANIVLADEINRTTPKTQSCLLEAMNDSQVTVDRATYRLERPFMVIATQNPIEYHGTYPLPESQMDRFFLATRLGYPETAVEREVVLQARGDPVADRLQPVVRGEAVLEIQDEVEQAKVAEAVLDYLMELVRRTRESPHLEVGASPRAAIALKRAVQARAYLEGRDYCLPDDVKMLAIPVLAHRLVTATQEYSPAAAREQARRALGEILEQTPVPM